MTKIATPMVPHRVLLVAKSTEHSCLKSLLNLPNIELIFSETLAAAAIEIEKNMPHLIVSEPWYPDGDIKKLRRISIEIDKIRRIPIVVWVPKRDNRALRLLERGNWEAIFEGAIPRNTFRKKIEDILLRFMSPHAFFLVIPENSSHRDVTVTFKAKIIGVLESNLIFATNIAMNPLKEFSLRLEHGMELTGLNALQNFVYQDKFLTIIRVPNDVRSSMRIIDALPKVKLKPLMGELKINRGRKILVQHRDQNTADEIKEAFEKVDFTVEHVRTFREFGDLFIKDPRGYQAIFVNEYFDMSEKSGLGEFYLAIPETDRPPWIICTEHRPPMSSGGIVFVQKPLAIKDLIHVLMESVFTKYHSLHQIDIEVENGASSE